MPFCPHCGREVGEEATYCARCGSRLREAGGERMPSVAGGTEGEPRAEATLPPVEGPRVPVAPSPAFKVARRRWVYPVVGGMVILLAAVAVLLALFLAGGRGMSLQEYKERAGNLHGEAGESLSELGLEMEEIAGSLSGSEDPEQIEDALAEMEGLLDECLAAVREARNGLQGMRPPKEAGSLHREFLDFYGECELAFAEAGLFFTYSRELISAMVGGYAKLTRFLTGDMATEEDIYRAMGALEEYYSDSLKELQAVQPPRGLEDFHRRFLETWNGISPVIADLRMALANQDPAKLASAESGLERWQSGMSLLAGELESRFDEASDELMNLGEKGADLEGELMAL